jgi:hypothetical protein
MDSRDISAVQDISLDEISRLPLNPAMKLLLFDMPLAVLVEDRRDVMLPLLGPMRQRYTNNEEIVHTRTEHKELSGLLWTSKLPMRC